MSTSARERRGTNIPGTHGCEDWAPAKPATRFERWFGYGVLRVRLDEEQALSADELKKRIRELESGL